MALQKSFKDEFGDLLEVEISNEEKEVFFDVTLKTLQSLRR